MISQLIHFNIHEQKYARVSLHSHNHVTCILNKDNISLIKLMLGKGNDGKSEWLLLLSLHKTVHLSGSVAEDGWVFYTGECSGPWRAPPAAPVPGAVPRFTAQRPRRSPASAASAAPAAPAWPGARSASPAGPLSGLTPVRGFAGDATAPLEPPAAVTLPCPQSPSPDKETQGPASPAPGEGEGKSLHSAQPGAQHPQKGQGGLYPPPEMPRSGRVPGSEYPVPRDTEGAGTGTPPVVLPQPGTGEEVTEGRVWPADVS